MAKKGSKFAKYSSEFKLQVVKDYLSGKSGGMPSIVKKYGLKSDNQGLTWTRKYRENPEPYSHKIYEALSPLAVLKREI